MTQEIPIPMTPVPKDPFNIDANSLLFLSDSASEYSVGGDDSEFSDSDFEDDDDLAVHMYYPTSTRNVDIRQRVRPQTPIARSPAEPKTYSYFNAIPN